VVGFPFGAADADAKRYETEAAIDNGAQEINTVINLGWLKDGEDSAILRELRDIVEAADERPVGVILELPLLSPAEKARACQLIAESAAKSLIASAGFGSGEPSVEEIKALRELLGEKLGVTAAGIIDDPQSAQALIEAGATRLATCAGVRLLRSVDSRV